MLRDRDKQLAAGKTLDQVEITLPHPAITYEPQISNSIPVPTPVCMIHINYKQAPNLHVVS